MCKCKWLLYDRNGNIRPLGFAITTSSIVFNCFIENVFFIILVCIYMYMVHNIVARKLGVMQVVTTDTTYLS